MIRNFVLHCTYIVSALLITFVMTLSLQPLSTSAIDDATLDFFNKNGIYYYNPDGNRKDCYSGLGSYDGMTTAGLSDLQASFIDTYHDLAEQLSAEYGIPWEAVMAQGIIESASGTSNFARNRYNFFGLGAVDTNPGAAYTFNSAAEGWRGYFDFIERNPRYRAAGAFNYAGDPYGYLQAIYSAGYATSPTYLQTVGSYITAVQNRATEKGWSSSASISATEASRSAVATSSYITCSSATAGNGDLNSTALALSWEDRSHSINDPKDAYLAALQAVGLTTYTGDDMVPIGASCDAFIATVLRFSGVDPNVPCCGAANMLNYFMTHPEKYEEIPNLGNASNLQPGDIRVKPKHIEMYVVTSDGAGHIASASHGDRTADHAGSYYADSAYRIYRVRK